MNREANSKKSVFLILVGLIGLAIIDTAAFSKDLKSDYMKKNSVQEIKYNRGLLEKLEKIDVNEVEKILAKSEAENKTKDLIKVSQKSNKEYFEDSVFMGDSLTEPLDFYNILNKSSVLAKKGQSVLDAKKSAQELLNLNPKKVFLLYGLNDLEMFKNASDFKKNYGELIDLVKQNAPNAYIYAQSVMPVQEKVNNKDYSSDRINEFTEAIKELGREKKINYIDIKPVIKNKEYLYEPDGMHFTIKFYDLWLDYLKNYLENQIEEISN